MQKIGKRIVVVVVSASGKSSFSRKLSKKINVPVFFMDSIMWKSGWNYIGDEETAKKINEVSNNTEWIIEGYIVKKERTFLFEKSDTIIYLDYSPVVASWRYIKRWWKNRTHARPELEGSPEKFSFKFLKLVWNKSEAISLDKFLSEVKKQEKIIKLSCPKETRKLLASIY